MTSLISSAVSYISTPSKGVKKEVEEDRRILEKIEKDNLIIRETRKTQDEKPKEFYSIFNEYQHKFKDVMKLYSTINRNVYNDFIASVKNVKGDTNSLISFFASKFPLYPNEVRQADTSDLKTKANAEIYTAFFQRINKADLALYTFVAGIISSEKTEHSNRKTVSEIKISIYKQINAICKTLEERGLTNELYQEIRDFITWAGSLPDQTGGDCGSPEDISLFTFSEIAGQHNAKANLTNSFILPFTYPLLFPTQAKGVLLWGPPGTGKTLLAKAAASEIDGVNYYAPVPGELKGKYEGETEKAIASVFRCAAEAVDKNKDSKISIIFFDEFDAVAGGSRSEDASAKRTINSLLQAMDGIKSSSVVSVIAATNYPWTLDSAVNRRFNTRVFIDLPDEDARRFIIKQSIVKYLTPGKTDRERKEILINEEMFMNLLITIKQTAIACSLEKVLSLELIERIVKETGNNQKAMELIESAKKMKIDLNKIPDGVKFGYSGSDLTKMMDTAFMYASREALFGPFVPTKINEEIYLVSVSEAYILNNNIAAYYTSSDKGEEVPADYKDRLLNYSVCENHILRAMEASPSTIKTREYVMALNYLNGNDPE